MDLSWSAAWGKVKRRQRKRQSAALSLVPGQFGRVYSNHVVDPMQTRACDASTVNRAFDEFKIQSEYWNPCCVHVLPCTSIK